MSNVSTFPTQVRNSSIEDSQCLVDAGEYEVVFTLVQLATRFKRPSMTMWFQIVSPGIASGLYLPRHYNLEWIKKNGGFKARRHSDCVREFIAVTHEPVKRLDRIPLVDRYKGRVILAKVRTVMEDSKHQKLPELARYSVIERLLRSCTR